MGNTHVVAIADPISPDALTFASLPLSLAQRMFLALPADARARACCVCRAWRDALADPSLWSRLDMSFVSDRADRQRFAALLRGAAGRVHGLLQELDVSQRLVTPDVLLPVLTANAASLRELHVRSVRTLHDPDDEIPSVEAVVAAAPRLHALMVKHVTCTWEDAPRLLRAEPPFAPLQMRHSLEVHFDGEDRSLGGMERVGPFAAALADATLQPALLHLRVQGADTAQLALTGALADAAVARRLRELSLHDCTPPAAAPLARLLAEGALVGLCTVSSPLFLRPQFDAAGAALVADALRANTTLAVLVLSYAQLSVNVRVAELLLGALVGHPSLRELHVSGEYTAPEDRGAFGAALGALIAADAPTLQILQCSDNCLRDAGLAPIVEALALNHHLRELDMGRNGMTEAFARERLLPAVRANTSLRELTSIDSQTGDAASDAEALVLQRERRLRRG